jgi:hypothetical protein
MDVAEPSHVRGAGKAPLSARERLLGGALILGGLAIAGYSKAYDASNWKVAVSLNAWAVVVSLCALAGGLAASGVPRGPRGAAALLGSATWNTLLLSQLAYVGFFFLPLEVLAATVILRSRAGVPKRWLAVTVAITARALSFVLIYAARPVAHALFLGR